MKVVLELTPELIKYISGADAKEILLQIITSQQNSEENLVMGNSPNGDNQVISNLVNKQRNYKTHSPELKSTILKEYNSGATVPELMKKHGLPSTTVWTWINNSKKKVLVKN